MALAVEVVGGFDYQALQSEQRILVQQRTSEICTLLRQQVYNAIEIGQKLLEIKQSLKNDNLYRQWIEAEFPWEKSAANRFEHVALRFSNVPNWDMLNGSFDLSALYILAAPSTPADVVDRAIELAESGERVSHARAKALKAGLDTPTIKAGNTYTVSDETSPYYGQTVTVQSIERKDGIVSCSTPDGGVASLPLSELINPAPEPPKPPKKEQPNHLGAIASELEIERERVQLLEGILQKLCAAARSGKLSDELLSEAESLL